MITLQEWLEIVNYRITETGDYGWTCYGEHAQVFTYWDGNHQGVSTDIIYDLKNQQVYEVTAHDFMMAKSYRMINPKYKEKHLKEVTAREQDDMAYDDVAYINLETVEDLREKLTAIINYKIYDTRIEVPLELGRDEMHQLMTQAHEHDMSLNNYVEHLLRRVVDEFKPETKKKGNKKK